MEQVCRSDSSDILFGLTRLACDWYYASDEKLQW